MLLELFQKWSNGEIKGQKGDLKQTHFLHWLYLHQKQKIDILSDLLRGVINLQEFKKTSQDERWDIVIKLVLIVYHLLC